ncbi:PDR/VanB family oxidoreductase [Paraburkholderia sp. D1E]|uniref:PDR/VanB family oxidoreductase n=1 Tax=Paraburkholderia sp. D1E TaxID=3461398 RepID=UPI004045E495
MDKISVIVQRKWPVAADIVALELVAAHGERLPPFSAGAHIDVFLDAPDGERPIIRQYSLCNAPKETDHYILGVKLEPQSRGGSRAVHERLREGAPLTISAPRNHFPLHEDADMTVLFAAGIGITPLLAMVQSLRQARRDFRLDYFARSPEHVAFADRLIAADDVASIHIHTGASVEDTERVICDVLAGIGSTAHVYACGPGVFMDMVGRHAAGRVPRAHFHVEHFAAPAAPASGREVFEVVAARSGVRCMVRADRSIVETLREYGVEIDVSCEQGVCGTCITRVISGVPDHRDVYLSDDERAVGDQITPCCSRALSDTLELDI